MPWQDAGPAGRIEHHQVGVFLVSTGHHGRAFLDRERDRPQGWVDDAARRAEAGVPAATVVRTTPQLAKAMLERAVATGGPATWVTGAEVYGGNRRLRVWLPEQDVPHVLVVKRTEPLEACVPPAVWPRSRPPPPDHALGWSVGRRHQARTNRRR